MGGALLERWLKHGISAAAVTVVEPQEDTAAILRDRHNLTVLPDFSATDQAAAQVVIFAVKPQTMEEILHHYVGIGGGDGRPNARPLFVSIAAGYSIDSLARHLGRDAAIVRAMPNAPAAIGHGITVACANPSVTEDQRALVADLFTTAGVFAWVESETLLDPVTAVSGSGPAYVFLLAECLAQAGVAAGLDEDLAQQLARATVSGSGALLDQVDQSAAELRGNVTSPGGTTEAALQVLMAEPGLQTLLTKAVAAATVLARRLSS
jgi:pyrroline-5-carboxylate reductase